MFYLCIACGWETVALLIGTKVALLVGRESDDGCCTAGWDRGGQTVIGRMLGGWERAALLVGKVGREVEDKGCPVD